MGVINKIIGTHSERELKRHKHTLDKVLALKPEMEMTLPVEFDASHRALKILGNTGMLYEDEVRDTRKVLTAAALTYVAGAASAILQLLRILLLTGNRRND